MKQFNFKLPLNFSNFMPVAVEPRKHGNQHKKESDQESFQPEYHQIKKMGLKPNKKKLRIGGWTTQENQTYLNFILQNIPDFSTEKARRTSKVFFRLSKILKKRTPDQCRSHHQKLQMKHGDNVEAIVEEIQRKVQKGLAEEYINDQMGGQFHSKFQPLITFQRKEPQKTGCMEPEEQNMFEGREWFNMIRSSNSIRIDIKSDAMVQWYPQ